MTASGTHTLNSVALTAGLAGSDNVAVGAAGTVTVNNIGGTTRAAVTGSDINASLDNSTADDVAVKAQDVTTSESHVGSLSVGIGADGGAGVSAASDTLLLSRETAAELSGTDTAKKTVNGRNVAVTAGQQSTVVTNADGVAGAGGVYGAGAVAATAAATKLNGSVSATMKNITSTNKGLEISAKHDHKTTLVSASAAVSAAMVSGAVGAGVGVVNDDFTTDAELVSSTVAAKKDSSLSDSGSVKVAADSSTNVTTVVAGVSGSVGAAASTISVNNVNSQTSAVVDNSKVTADQDFTVDAHNKVTTKFNAATLGAGGAAIATGVGVNTIGTSTLAKVNQSTVTARKAAVASREELDVDQNLVGATVGGLGINANVMVTSIGTQLADTYGSSCPEDGHRRWHYSQQQGGQGHPPQYGYGRQEHRCFRRHRFFRQERCQGHPGGGDERCHHHSRYAGPQRGSQDRCQDYGGCGQRFGFAGAQCDGCCPRYEERCRRQHQWQ